MLKKVFLQLNIVLALIIVLFAGVSYAEDLDISKGNYSLRAEEENGKTFLVVNETNKTIDVRVFSRQSDAISMHVSFSNGSANADYGFFTKDNERYIPIMIEEPRMGEDNKMSKIEIYSSSYIFQNNYVITNIFFETLDPLKTVESEEIKGNRALYQLENNKVYFLKVLNSNISEDDLGGITDYNPIAQIVEESEDEAEWYEKIIAWFIRQIGKGLNWIVSVVAGEPLSIDKLVFDEYSRTQLSIFKRDREKYFGGKNPLLEDNAIDPLNTVFELFRNIALVAYMIILVYMGIQILLQSTAVDKQARYKELLFNWVKGIAILFLFPYVFRYAILLNHGFVSYLKSNVNVSLRYGDCTNGTI